LKKFETHDLIIQLNKTLAEKEKSFYSQEQKLPPVFIAGAPRSGTTLLYQVLVSAFDIGYIDNISAKFWDAPLSGLVLSDEIYPFEKRILTNFNSEYGFTSEPLGPHEFGYFWRRWFDYKETHELSVEQLDKIDKENLKRTIFSMNNVLNKPVAFKNAVAITLQIEYLAKTFSGAIILSIEREPLYNAQSILEARLRSGNPEEWFSAKPAEYLKLKDKSYIEQVVGQVYFCNEKISRARNYVRHSDNSARWIDIKYEELCEAPDNIIDIIDEKLKKYNVKRKNVRFGKFESSNKIKIEKEIFEKLQTEFGKYY